MSKSNSEVFLALQLCDESRAIVEAVEQDNPQARVTSMPAMVRIDAPGRLVVNRSTVEKLIGTGWDVQRIHVNLISISGHVEETEDFFALEWPNAVASA